MRSVSLLAAVALLVGVPAVAAAPTTSLRIASFTLAPDGTFSAGARLEVDARVRNTARTTVRAGRFELYLRRHASTSPAGRPDASARVPAARGRTVVIARAQVTLTRAMRGRYRLVACVRTPARARACRPVRGTVTVR